MLSIPPRMIAHPHALPHPYAGHARELQVFGVDVAASNPAEALEVEPARPESSLSMRVNAVLAALRAPGQHHQQCFVVRQVRVGGSGRTGRDGQRRHGWGANDNKGPWLLRCWVGRREEDDVVGK